MSKTVYVAAPFSQKEKAKEIMRQLEKDGYRISHDWTKHVPIKPYSLHEQIAREYADKDIEGASNCSIFVMLPDATGGSTLYAELGAAIVSKKVRNIFVVDEHNTDSLVFFHPRVKRIKSVKQIFIKI